MGSSRARSCWIRACAARQAATICSTDGLFARTAATTDCSVSNSPASVDCMGEVLASAVSTSPVDVLDRLLSVWPCVRPVTIKIAMAASFPLIIAEQRTRGERPGNDKPASMP